MTKVILNQHNVTNRANEPCAGIVYVHKREDCVMLAARISKVYLFKSACILVVTSIFMSVLLRFATDDWSRMCTLPCRVERF